MTTRTPKERAAGPARQPRVSDTFAMYVLEVASRDEAMAWAHSMPAAGYGSVEVREILPEDPS